jgi:hypothetical protein
MAIFGFITEGYTDQIVIENILIGLLNDDDLFVTRLQPTLDETAINSVPSHGNWHKALQYCESQDFKDAFLRIDYAIIQIDADIFKTQQLPLAYQINLAPNITPEETITAIKEKIIDLIGEVFYQNHNQKIIFAISVDAIECWLLPIYYQNLPAKASKTTGCLKSLNEKLSKDEGFTIDKKSPKYYRIVSKKYLKHKESKKLYALNPSLRIFVEDIQQIIP